METLSFNSSTTKIANEAAAAEVTLNSSSPPGCSQSGLGEQANNVPTPEDIISPSFVPPKDYQWFYMHASYGKNKLAQEALSREGIFSYIPYETIRGYSSNGTISYIRKPIFTSYLFVFAPLDKIKLFVNISDSEYSLPYLHFVYDHARRSQYGTIARMVVPHNAMTNFIRLAEFKTSKVHSVDEKKVHFVKDTPVKIVEGVFKGIVGRVARIHNQTTVVVTLEGIISMTTAYIPKHFMVPYTE